MARYTEIFYSVQGEALHTGKLCTWLRLFACSLQCRGFGQKDPADPSTWVEQRVISPKEYTDLKQVPTPNVGCDSDYSWSAQFKHLVVNEDNREIATKIRALTKNNTFGKIGHVFTGGEPLMQQKAIIEIVNHWIEDGDYPAWIGFETNTTQKLTPDFVAFLEETSKLIPMYFSMSPKLLHVAGEQPKKAIHINNIRQYKELLPDSYLKFVLNEDQRSWDQAEGIVNDLQTDIDVWVMPVGGSYEDQTDDATGRIADKAIFEYEWNVSPRVHVLIWANDQIGR